MSSRMPRNTPATAEPTATTASRDEVADSSAQAYRLWHCCPRLIHRAVVDSTNAHLVRLLDAEPDVEDWTTVVADHQTAGRGRYTRTWFDQPQSALLFSTVVRVDTYRLGWLTLLAGVALTRALINHHEDGLKSVEARVKWPNDVIVGGKKVAGILTEHVSQEGDQHTVVLGVGLNIGSAPPEAGPDAGAIAASDPVAVRDQLLTDFLTQYRSLLEEKDNVPAVWRQQYTELLVGVGQETTIHLASGETITATVDGVDDDGGLCIRHGGNDKTITCGDVALVSPEIVSANSRKNARDS